MYQGVNGNGPKFTRTGSQICATPEEELLEAVFNNNIPRIEQLLTRNENLLTYTYPDYSKRILLIACSEDNINARTVEKLLNFRANPRDYTSENGWEALHWASQKTDYEILNVLLKRNPGDVNVPDQYGNNALHILIRYGQRDSPDFLKCAGLLIKKGINPYHTNNKNQTILFWADKKGVGNDIRNLIEDNQGSNLLNEHTNNNLRNEKDDGKQLVNYLNQENEQDFIDFRNGDIDDLANYCDGNSTLLQICCRKNLILAAKHLLDHGANPELTGDKNSTKPLMIAAENGFVDIFKSLLERYEPISRIPQGLLANILQYIDNNSHNNMGCYKAFMERIRKEANPDMISLKLNEVDKNNNTALHYAIRYADSEIIEELLSLGASLGSKNKFGIMPIQDIDPETLKKHLDDCVKFDLKSKKIEKEDFQVKFNYRSLIPPYAKLNVDQNKDSEAAGMNSTIKKQLVRETEVIFFMSKSSEFKHLLKHPVIVSFLFMKWRRIQWLFWTNLIFYFIFALSLLIYILSSYAYFSQDEKSAIHTLIVNLFYGCLIITLFILICRELFQICVEPSNYFKNFENYIEIILIILAAMIVFISSPSDNTRKQLSAISILLAAFELVIMLGQHPKLSTNVVMLKTVSFNFFKFLMWYSLLIFAFALSFYILFTTEANENNSRLEITNGTAEDKTEDDDKSFDNPGKSVFKTIIMLTGEFDASSINFDTFPVTSKLIFAFFIFMIAIILLNLLNGLAVSDTQLIKNDAELVGHIARAEHIRYVESMLVEYVRPTNVMHKLNDICCCLPISRKRNFRIRNTLSKDASLFPNHLNYELVFYPNKYGLIEPNGDETILLRKSCIKCTDTFLDRETIRRTTNIMQSKRNSNSKNIEEQIKTLEEKINKLHEMLSDRLSKTN